MKNLVIVESPAKAKTIEKYLGKGFKVLASYGHVRDLPKAELGVDVEHDFKPKYVIPTKVRKNLNILKKQAEEAQDLYLATDLDREGEAIAWHIIQALDLNEIKNQPSSRAQVEGKSKIKNIKRIIFNEITESTIKNSLKAPRGIDMNLVDAQQARRVLDRLVGYKLSPLLWKKIRKGLSAGRVQSVALMLIIEREKEIQAFKPQEYWQIEAVLTKKENIEDKFPAKLSEKDGKRLGRFAIKTKDEALKITKDLEGANFTVLAVDKKQKIRNPYPPHKTSTLQQDAAHRLGFSAKKTMLLAQQLYEGIELGEKGALGLITYMRTDSLNLSQDFIGKTSSFIEKNFGVNYKNPRVFKTTSKGAQEAHEAIRPTDIYLSPDYIKNYLDPDQLKLYTLVYNRALASQMAEAIFDTTQVKIKASQYGFTSSGSVLKFDGFLKVYKNSEELGEKIPELKEGEELDLKELKPIQSFTQPPARYSEASLVKILEEYGIGRPSTYAPIMSTIVTRGYVKKEKGVFIPQEIGYAVNKLLVEHFSDIVNVKFTAKIEEELDEIAQGKIQWVPVIREFYEPFEKDLEKKHEEIEKVKLPEEKTDLKCEKCGKPMIIKIGRYGKFLACSGFPECKNAKPLLEEIKAKCPECGEKLVKRRTRKGRFFYGCKGYPSCKFATWEEPLEKQCEKCASLLVKNKKGDIHCVECDFVKKE